MHDGTVHTIWDVRHVEGLKKNLLSLGQLDDLGCKVEIQNKIMKIIKGALVLMKGEKVAANLYQLKGQIMEEAEALVTSHSPSQRVAITWHQKLGHIVYVLELVHSDVWKAPVLSLGGAKYFVSIIDDYSRRCYVYPIKKKSDVFDVFKVYKARVELDSGKKIKCLRTDNGGEYTGDEFDTFCRQEGIKRQFTTAYTPQQNGVAERMNRTLLERARDYMQKEVKSREAFERLKQAMSSAPVLKLPDFTKEFTLEADASGSQLGTVLLQQGHPTSFLITTGKTVKGSYTWANQELKRKGKLVVGDDQVLRTDLLKQFHEGSVGVHSRDFYNHYQYLQPFGQVYPWILLKAYPNHKQGKTMIFVVVDRLTKEATIELLKFHLRRAQDRMKSHADRNRTDRQYELDDWVYLKLQPHRQVTIRKGVVTQSRNLPACGTDGLILAEPVAILERRLAKKGNSATVFVLLQWSNGSKKDATWEPIEDLQKHFPYFQG
ncbi:gag-pol polyprotein [Tanacetum coccineum]